MRVALVDQLAAVLRDLPSAKAPRSVQQRPPIRSLASWISAVAGLAEPVRGAEPGEAGPTTTILGAAASRAGAASGRAR